METLVTIKVSIVLLPDMTDIDPKERIKLAAHELIMKYSIRTVSMDDIANSVGMSKKTVYHYYKDKDDLMTEVVEGIIAENRFVCDEHLTKSENAVHEIFLAMQMMVKMFESMHPNIIYEMQKYHSRAFRRFHEHKTQFLLSHIENNITRGMAEELYRPELNVQILSRFRIETMFIPFQPDFQRILPDKTLLELHDEIILHFLFGMVTPKGYKLAMKYMSDMHKNSKINY